MSKTFIRCWFTFVIIYWDFFSFKSQLQSEMVKCELINLVLKSHLTKSYTYTQKKRHNNMPTQNAFMRFDAGNLHGNVLLRFFSTITFFYRFFFWKRSKRERGKKNEKHVQSRIAAVFLCKLFIFFLFDENKRLNTHDVLFFS